MTPRIDDKRSDLTEKVWTGSTSPRPEALLSASTCPSGHAETFEVRGQTIVLRPIRVDDARAYDAMISVGDASGVGYRFPQIRRPISKSLIARDTQIDHDLEMAFVAAGRANESEEVLLGEVRLNVFPGSDAAEFAIFVHPHARGLGIGRALLLKMIRHCTDRGFSELIGQVAPENERMLALARSVGMHVYHAHGAGIAIAYKKLPGAFTAASSTTSSAPFATDRAAATTGNANGMTVEHLRPRTLALPNTGGRSAYAGLESHG